MGSLLTEAARSKCRGTPVQRFQEGLLRRIENSEIERYFVITHTVRLDDGPAIYKVFRDKQDGYIKLVPKPGT